MRKTILMLASVFLYALFISNVVSASDLYVNPKENIFHSDTSNKGDYFNVAVNITNATELYGFEFQLTYDSNLIATDTSSVSQGQFADVVNTTLFLHVVVVGPTNKTPNNTADANKDGKIDIYDFVIVGKAYGSYCEVNSCSEGHTCWTNYSTCNINGVWDPRADVNNATKNITVNDTTLNVTRIDLYDLVTVMINYGTNLPSGTVQYLEVLVGNQSGANGNFNLSTIEFEIAYEPVNKNVTSNLSLQNVKLSYMNETPIPHSETDGIYKFIIDDNDKDGWSNEGDNCPTVYNPDQNDSGYLESFETDPVGTSFNDITGWDVSYQSYEVWNKYSAEDLSIKDTYYFNDSKSVYSYTYLNRTVWNWQSTDMEAPVDASKYSYITFWVGGDGYTTNEDYDRYWWAIALDLSDGTNDWENKVRCDCWGNGEGCSPNHYNYYNGTGIGADGNAWKRYTIKIPSNLDKSNLFIKIKHYQNNWGPNASSWYYLDNVCFSDASGNCIKDNVGDVCDNCWYTYNPNQNDTDGDCSSFTKPYTQDPHCGDACDNCPSVVNPYQNDSDSDNVGNACDNCWYFVNPNQLDSNGNCVLYTKPYSFDPLCGDACEPDLIIDDIWYSGRTIFYRIKNQGFVNAGSSHSNLRVEGSLYGVSDYVKPITVGSSENRWFGYYWSCIANSSDTITVCADVNGEVYENNENNNCKTEIWPCPYYSGGGGGGGGRPIGPPLCR